MARLVARSGAPSLPCPCIATPNSPRHCLACKLNASCSPSYKFRISRHLYFPKPKVDGGVVDFALLPPAERVPVTSDTKFLGLVGPFALPP